MQFHVHIHLKKQNGSHFCYNGFLSWSHVNSDTLVLPNYEITLLDELSQRDCMGEGTNPLELVLFAFITMASHFCSTGTARRLPG